VIDILKNEAIKELEKKASFYLDNGDVISAQACLAQIKVITGHTNTDHTQENTKTIGINYK